LAINHFCVLFFFFFSIPYKFREKPFLGLAQLSKILIYLYILVYFPGFSVNVNQVTFQESSRNNFEDDLNFLSNGRRSQYLTNGRQPQYLVLKTKYRMTTNAKPFLFYLSNPLIQTTVVKRIAGHE
jgi:hypothetical protein